MRKFFIENLNMIVTENCNLNCAHCFRGEKHNINMSKEVIENTLKDVMGIGQLSLGGGEPMLAEESILNILNYLITNKIYVTKLVIVTNGTYYSPAVTKALKQFSDYMIKLGKLNARTIVDIRISKDDFHTSEVEKYSLESNIHESIRKYRVHFDVAEQYLEKIYGEGNANNLPNSIEFYDVGLDPIVFGYEQSLPFIHVGPVLVINASGIITNLCSSFDHQQKEYNFGNVFENSLPMLAQESGIYPWEEYQYMNYNILAEGVYNKAETLRYL